MENVEAQNLTQDTLVEKLVQLNSLDEIALHESLLAAEKKQKWGLRSSII